MQIWGCCAPLINQHEHSAQAGLGPPSRAMCRAWGGVDTFFQLPLPVQPHAVTCPPDDPHMGSASNHCGLHLGGWQMDGWAWMDNG